MLTELRYRALVVNMYNCPANFVLYDHASLIEEVKQGGRGTAVQEQ